MNALFPVMLDLRGWPCAVLGGGAMAEEKVRLFEGTGARLVLIAEDATAPLRQLAEAGAIEWWRRAPVPEDAAGFRLVISTLADPAANAALAEAASRAGALFNAADDPRHCRFLLPSVHRQGALVVAVSTSGRCPALAVRLRQRLAALLDAAYAEFLAICEEFRPVISRKLPDFSRRRQLWYEIADSDAIRLVREGRPQDARRVVETLIEKSLQEALP
jgi:siroheme synthase-like protein